MRLCTFLSSNNSVTENGKTTGKSIMVITREETVEHPNNAFWLKHSVPGDSMCAVALPSDIYYTVGRNVQFGLI